MRIVSLDLERPRTLAAVTRILQRCFRPESVPYTHPHKQWWGVVDAQHHLVAVASLDGDVLWDLSVHPRYRRQGVATRLAEHLCGALPLVRLYLAEPGLVAFYTRLGFVLDAGAELPLRAVLSMVRRNAAKEVPSLAANE